MRARALEDRAARPAAMVPRAESASAPGPARVYAAILERDGQGVPTRIALPGPTAADRIPLFVQHPGGSPAWAAAVTPNGEVVGDLKRGVPARKQELGLIKPGTRIIAVGDASGRVLALQALARLPAPAPAKATPRIESAWRSWSGTPPGDVRR